MDIAAGVAYFTLLALMAMISGCGEEQPPAASPSPTFGRQSEAACLVPAMPA